MAGGHVLAGFVRELPCNDESGNAGRER